MDIPALIFITYTEEVEAKNPARFFFVYKKAEQMHDTADTDVSLSYQNKATTDFDTLRLPCYRASINAGTSRGLVNGYNLDGSTSRRIETRKSADHDVVRTLSKSLSITDSLSATMERVILNQDSGNADVSRSKTVISSLINDIQRSTLCRKNTIADTSRQIATTNIIHETGTFDLSINNLKPESLWLDTLRINRARENRNFDAYLQIQRHEKATYYTCRALMYNAFANSDTARQIPYTTNGLNPQSISINLEKGQLSESFEMVTPYDLPLDSSITGRLLDFDYSFKVYQTSGTGLMRNITGMYDVDRLLYMPFTYTLSKGRHSAKEHAQNIAKLLGKSLYWATDDFIASETFAGIGGATIQNMISGLFGWAGNLPQDWINVFLRGETLKIVQRGHEPNEIDITGTAHSRPEITRRLMRSVWSGTGSHSARNRLTIAPLGFSGTIRFGDSEVTYSNGLVVHEVTVTAQGKSVTDYDYDFDDYLVKKITTTPDEVITTTYDYAITLNDKYLATETAVSTDKSGNVNSTTVTQHVYLGNGWYGTAVYVDGAFQSSSVSSGKPGGKANKYIIDQSNLNLGSGYPKDDGGQIEGAALFDTEFPIYDSATLKKLTRDIEWLNRRTEEKVTMDIWQYGHLIDFTDRVKYQGNTYYLESNQVSRTPSELKQTVTIVRWF